MRSHGEAWNVFCQNRRAGVKGCEVSPKIKLIQASLVNDDHRWLIQERYLAKPTPTLLLALHNSWRKLPEPGWKFVKWVYSLIEPEAVEVGWSSKGAWVCLPPSLYQQSTASLPVWVRHVFQWIWLPPSGKRGLRSVKLTQLKSPFPLLSWHSLGSYLDNTLQYNAGNILTMGWLLSVHEAHMFVPCIGTGGKSLFSQINCSATSCACRLICEAKFFFGLVKAKIRTGALD